MVTAAKTLKAVSAGGKLSLPMVASLSPGTTLSEAEEKRLRRFQRSIENRRGRENPAIVPSKLVRTAAFVPRRRGLSTDGAFSSVYIVRPHTVVHVVGRELGSQHRDAIYAIFRSRARKISEPNPAYVAGTTDPVTAYPRTEYYYAQTTWRDLLLTTGRTAHVNNLGSLLRCFEEIRSVSFRVFQGTPSEYDAQIAIGRLSGSGFSDNLINEIRWDGVSLDSQVTVKYGAWVRQTFEAKNLVSLNADVYFRLKSDYAKAFWPFIDSQPNYTYVDDATLAELAGRDYRAEDSKKRAKFREDVVQALNDMVLAGGLASWSCEVLGAGRQKTYRYRYEHALPRQGQLALDRQTVPVVDHVDLSNAKSAHSGTPSGLIKDQMTSTVGLTVGNIPC